jgi:AraC-like DNA-binding protein
MPARAPTQATPLEFMDLPLGRGLPIVWTINEFARPSGRHFDIHAGIEIGIVLAGSSRRIYGEHSFVARPGDAWLTNLWEPHGMQILRPRTRHLVLGMLPEFLGYPDTLSGCDWLAPFRLSPPRRPMGRSHARANLQVARHLIHCLSTTDPLRLARVRILLQELLLSLMPDLPGTPAEPVTAGGNDLTALLQYVDQHAGEKITLADAAEAAGMSRSRFAETFRRQTGLTFARYVVRRRIGGVMHDLRLGRQKLATLADRWGFADASHLVRVFREHVNATPDEYRRQAGAVESPSRGSMPKPLVFA